MTNHSITIHVTGPFRPMRMVYTVAMQVGVIGIGVAVESTAMQWSGFVVLALIAVALSILKADEKKDLSIQGAREYLDRLERDGCK